MCVTCSSPRTRASCEHKHRRRGPAESKTVNRSMNQLINSSDGPSIVRVDNVDSSNVEETSASLAA